MTNGKNFKVILCLALFSLSGASAYAIPSFNPSNLGALTTADVNNLLRLVAVGADYKPLMPASALGYTIGIDVGLNVEVVSLPSSFVNSLALATGSSAGSIPTILPVPTLVAHKGLPFGIDVGFDYLAYQNFISIYGADVKWTFMDGGLVKPNLAVRLIGNFNKFWFLETRTYSIDAMISKNFAMLEPYGGLGLQTWSGNIAIPVNYAGSSMTVADSTSGTNPRAFAGLSMKLLVLRFLAEVNYSFAGVLSYGGKFSISF